MRLPTAPLVGHTLAAIALSGMLVACGRAPRTDPPSGPASRAPASALRVSAAPASTTFPARPTGGVSQPEPAVIIPPGVASTQTAEQVAEKMLAAIAANEQVVGRALAPPRIIRIQLLRPGEVYSMRRLDGTGSLGDLSPRGRAPGWVVEAVGTFIDPIGRDGGLATNIGTHGFRIWGDDGLGAYDWFPCWVRTSAEFHANEMEGQCAPP